MTDTITTKSWDVRWEGLVPARPDVVWAAITAHPAGHLWPIAYEPWAGGAESGLTAGGGTVTVWEPGARFATRAADGGNELDYVLTPHDGGATTYLNYAHRHTVAADAYDVQLAMCRAHTTFYLHSLGQQAAHFGGADPAEHRSVDAAEGTTFAAVRAALGVPADAVAGDRITALDAVVDYATGPFLGVRTAGALHRVFGRDAWGYRVGVVHHVFDPGAVSAAWRSRLDAASPTRKA